MKNILTAMCLFVLAVVIGAIYFKTLKNPPIFDDAGFGYLTHSASIELPKIFDFEIRKLPELTFQIVYKFSKRIELHRAINVFIHILNTILLFIMLFRFKKNRSASMFVSVFFGLNPAAMYAVAYLMQRSILMVVMLGLLQIIFYHMALNTKRFVDSIIFFVISVLACVLACNCKEQAFPLATVFILLPIVLRKKVEQYDKYSIYPLHEDQNLSPEAQSDTVAKNIRFYIYFVISTIVFIYFAKMAIAKNHFLAHEEAIATKDIMTMCGIDGELHSRSIATQAFLFFKYAYMWINPFADRSVDMREPFAATIFSTPQVYGLIAYLGVFALGVWLTIRRNVVGFALILIWTMFLVEIQTARLQDMFVLYRSYLYSICYMIIIAYVISKLKLCRSAIISLTICLLFIFGITTYKELDQFKSPVALWQRAADIIKPDSKAFCQASRIYSNLGAELFKEKRISESIPPLETALKIGTAFGPTLTNLANSYLFSGRVEEAKKLYEQALTDNEQVIKDAANAGLKIISKIENKI